MIAEIGAHPADGRPLLHAETREEWRGWLEQNHLDKVETRGRGPAAAKTR